MVGVCVRPVIRHGGKLFNKCSIAPQPHLTHYNNLESSCNVANMAVVHQARTKLCATSNLSFSGFQPSSHPRFLQATAGPTCSTGKISTVGPNTAARPNTPSKMGC